MTSDLNERSREVLRLVVEAYVETGEPIGSRSLSRKLSLAAIETCWRLGKFDLQPHW